MSRTAPVKQKKAQPQVAAHAGYRKGAQTRQRILDSALKAFGGASFRDVTTRQIAEAAGVSLPTLQYYFGDKEGLYSACAASLIERYRKHTSAAATAARDALNEGCSATVARRNLKAVIGALAEFLVGSSDAQRWAQFVARELRDAGPTFELLYENLWRPGIEIVARLIARVQGSADSNQAARVQALLLISSLLAFQPGRSISLRALYWTSIGRAELATVLSVLNAQIDSLRSSQR